MSDIKHKVRVALDKQPYDILIGNGLLVNAYDYIAPLLKTKRIFLVTDETVRRTEHFTHVCTALKSYAVHEITLPAGEATKQFSQLETLCGQILSHQPERNDTLIALGGGVIGDITGFAASILLRGMPFIQIPTTLLAMVDSSVGGKTGINTSYGKNLVGSFYQPKLVLADMDVLTTLPKREWNAGYAEIVKYGLIDSPDFFATLEKQGAQLDVSEAIRFSCERKAAIVAADEKEKSGTRALLNLGHTFGHALEAEMGYDGRLLHGEAVAMGMIMAFAFSAHLGLCDAAHAPRIEKLFKTMGMKTHPRELDHAWNAETMVQLFYQDKKVENQSLVFVLAKDIGQSFLAKNINPQDVKKFLESYV